MPSGRHRAQQERDHAPRGAGSELQAREQRCLRMLESMSEGFGLAEIVRDRRGQASDLRLLEVNEAFGRLTGLPAREAVGRTALGLLPGLQRCWIETFAHVAASGEHADFETWVDELGKWFKVRLNPAGPDLVAFLIIDITERKRAADARIAELKLADAVFTHSVTPLVVLDRHYNFLRVNEAYARACGHRIEQFAGRNHFEMYPSDARRLFDDVLRTKRPYMTFTRAFLFPDQPQRGVTYWDWTLVPILDETGKVEALVLSLMDVTERKRGEETLRESEAALRRHAAELELIYRTAPIGLCVIDAQLRYVHINDYLAERHGVAAPDHLGRTVREVVPWLADLLEPLLRQVLESGEPARNVEHAMERPSGVRHQWVSQYWPLRTAEGMVYGVSVVAEDVTERRRLVEARRREEEFRSLAENSTDVIARFDRDLRRVYVNRAIEAILGRPREELLNKTHREIGLPAPLADALDAELRKVYATRQPHEVGVVVPTPRGERYLDARLVPEFGPDGEVATVLTITRDLTDRKRAEDALQESERKYRALVENLYEGIWLLDAEARTTFANARLGELLGYAPDEMLGRPWFDFMDPRCVEEARRYLERGRGGAREEYDFELKRKDGAVLWAHIAATPLIDEAGHYTGVLAGVIDITGRKKAEDELRRREQEFSALVERAPDIIARVDSDLRLSYINPAVEQLTGRPREWFLGKAPDERELPLLQATARADVLKRVFETGEEQTVEHKNPSPQGERYFQTRLVPEFGPERRVESVLLIERDIDDLKRTQQALEEQTQVDPLTGIGNRRFLERFAEREWLREARHHLPIAAIMIDVDDFKAYNDHFGHAQGDVCLRHVADALRESLLRPADTLVRYGGEEFVVLLPESDLAAAVEIAERLRRAVEERAIPHPVSRAGDVVTISLGVAAVMPHEGEFEALLQAADAALYEAKKRGRNCVATCR